MVSGIQNHCYRVRGHYGGQWDKTEWVKTEAEADRMYREIQQGNWTQLTIERTDGARKPNPDACWHTEGERTND